MTGKFCWSTFALGGGSVLIFCDLPADHKGEYHSHVELVEVDGKERYDWGISWHNTTQGARRER